ncbi:MAG: putative MAPEG superfamily protein [Planctomycetota bacterium]|jgi:uncharacterized MAPEG superfamily protein
MIFELWILIAATFWGLVHLTFAALFFKAQVGNKYTMGSRDEQIQPAGIAARFYRAQWNFLETYPFFAVCVMIVFITNSAGSLSYWGAWLYLVGRVLFLPFYAADLPWLRSLAWNIATLGLVLVGSQVFF